MVTAPCGSWPGCGVTQLSQVPGLSACTGGAIAPLFSSPLTTVNCFWNGASGLRIGESSKPEPSAAGVHCSMIAPCGRYMNPRRGLGDAAVCASAVHAGTIASSRGRPMATPAPRRNVRRDRCFFVMNIRQLHGSRPTPPCGISHISPRRHLLYFLRHFPHLKRHALHNAHNDGREPVVVTRRVTDDASDDGHVIVFDASTQGIAHQLPGHV